MPSKTITIQTIGGPRDVTPLARRKGLAITPREMTFGGPCGFTITHIRSGRAVVLRLLDERQARLLLRRLSTLCDWTRLTPKNAATRRLLAKRVYRHVDEVTS